MVSKENNENPEQSQQNNDLIYRSGRKESKSPKSKKFTWFWGLIFVICLLLTISLSGLAGFQSGTRTRVDVETLVFEFTLSDQFKLGVQDLDAGRYEVALNRFEYIIKQDPNFPGVIEKMTAAMAVVYATATPSEPPPTSSPTPTRDLRPVKDLFEQARIFVNLQDWNNAIDTLTSLRKEDHVYNTTQVDGYLFISLRSRGVSKIWKEGNLVGGLYDLSLAERFGPLDVQAISARDLARLYVIGSSFWEVHPEEAVYYFSQVAAAAPGLRDASGWTANERYREALIQYGNLLTSNQEWCEATTQYELAIAIRLDNTLNETYQIAYLRCHPPTETPSHPEETLTSTPALPIPPTAIPKKSPKPTQKPPTEEPPKPTKTFTPEPSTPHPTKTKEISPSPQPTESPTSEALKPYPPENQSAPDYALTNANQSIIFPFSNPTVVLSTWNGKPCSKCYSQSELIFLLNLFFENANFLKSDTSIDCF